MIDEASELTSSSSPPTCAGSAEISRFWGELLDGRWCLLDHFCTSRRSYGILRACTPSEQPRHRMPLRAHEILLRCLGGESQKRIALDLQLSEAAVALLLANCRKCLHVAGRTAEMPLVVALMAQPSAYASASLKLRHVGGRAFKVVSLARPDVQLGPPFTTSEVAVVQLFLEGHSTEAIAGIRKTRPRTVSNQLSSIREKMRATSRYEVLSVLSANRRPWIDCWRDQCDQRASLRVASSSNR